MKKFIHIDRSTVSGDISRILSMTDSQVSPNGLEYIEVNYVEKPETTSLEIAYPLYKHSTNEMLWSVVEYQTTQTDLLLHLQSSQIRISELTSLLMEANSAIEDLTVVTADIIGGGI